jgi:hypothetical protein
MASAFAAAAMPSYDRRFTGDWAKEKSGVPRGNGWSNSATLTAWRA